MTTDNLQTIAQILKNAAHVAILTGAGISKESGVPTFRDALEGLWAKYDPAQLATPEAFERDPALVWSWYQWRRDMVKQAQPNPAHDALAQLQAMPIATTLITQNVDDLHERAGSVDVIHLHGNIAKNKCVANCQGMPTIIEDIPSESRDDGFPPPCPYCGGYIRPDVVWFGEALPSRDLQHAQLASEKCDVMLVVGTSGLVTPAATLPLIALQAGATLIEVNPMQSAITAYAHHWVQAPAGLALATLMTIMQTIS